MGCTERPTIWGYETVPQPCAELYMGYIDGHSTLREALYVAYRPLFRRARPAICGISTTFQRARPAICGISTTIPTCAACDVWHIDHFPACGMLDMGHIDRLAGLRGLRYGAYRPLLRLNFVVAHLPAASCIKFRSRNCVPNARK